MNYRAVVFDFFGVISSEVAPRWLRKYFPKGEIAKVEKKYIFPSDQGEISYDRLTEQLGGLIGVSSKAVKKEWWGLVKINDNVVSLIRKIKNGHMVGLLSDAQSGFLRAILRKYNLEKLFDAIVISSEVKTTKKYKEIYILTLNALGADASETIFIDDNEENVRLAKEIGMKGCVYNSSQQLTQELAKRLFL